MDEIDITDEIIFPEKDIRNYGSSKYSDDYKASIFQIWYNKGKPPATDLLDMIPFPETNYGRKPSHATLTKWIADFRERANELDMQVQDTMDTALVEAKIEMLKRHVGIAREAQEIAMDYLRTAELTPAAAVRLLVDALGIEKGSLGIPEAISKVISMSDEDLYKELSALVEDSAIEMEKLDE